jgi:hypothetical protein
LRISRVFGKPSASIRALTASAVRWSITRLVAVLSEITIIRRIASCSVSRSPGANSPRMPEPPTCEAAVSVSG